MDIDKESLRSKIDMLFRMYCAFHLKEVKKEIPQDHYDWVVKLVFNLGFNVIHSTKERDKVSNDAPSYQQAADRMYTSFQEILREVMLTRSHGLEIKLSFDLEQLMIKRGLNQLTDELVDLYQIG